VWQYWICSFAASDAPCLVVGHRVCSQYGYIFIAWWITELLTVGEC
jgi:hypothetical protein